MAEISVIAAANTAIQQLASRPQNRRESSIHKWIDDDIELPDQLKKFLGQWKNPS